MKIVIIEDEKNIAKDLAFTLKAVNPKIEIAAQLLSVQSAIQFFADRPEVDLIFSDIQLGDGLSFEIFKNIDNTAPVIFCTAYSEYALEAFKTNSIDYLLKPFSEQTVAKSLEKYDQLKANMGDTVPDFSKLLTALQPASVPQIQSILVRSGEKITPVALSDIALFYVEDSYTFVHTFGNKRHLVSQNLEQLASLCGRKFYRANRSFLVQRTAIKDVSKFFNRKLLLNLTVPFSKEITVGKAKTTDFLEWLAN